MQIHRVVNYENDQNCYIVYDKNNNAVVIDPGDRAEVIYSEIEKLGVRVGYILLTHCHYDHIGGLNGLRKLTGAKVCASFECNIGIGEPLKNLSSFFDEQIKCEPCDIIVNDKDFLQLGELEIEVITTPGHTKGGVCYLIGDDLFSGDTLFLRSVGRWDFPGGDRAVLESSIKDKLYTLDDDIIVHPGHGNDTKIYYEKRYNTFIKE